MDLGKTQKMNSMIKELTKHGQVSAFGTPYEVATELYSEGLPDQKESDSSDVEGANSSEYDIPKASINEGHVKFLIDQKLDAYKSELNSMFAAKFTMIKQELSNVRVAQEAPPKEELSSQQDVASQKEEVPQEAEEGANDAPPAPAAKVEEQETLKEPEAHPKNGSFSPNDVSVDKIFYCGQK